MKVLILNAHGQRRGGSQKSVWSLCRALRSRGHTIEVASPPGDFQRDLQRDGFCTHTLPATRWMSGALHQAGLANALRLGRLLHRRDLKLIHTFQYGSHLLARGVAALLGLRAAHTVCGPLSPGQRFAPGCPIITISEQFTGDAIKAGAAPDEVRVAPGQLELTHFPATQGGDAVVLISRLDGHLARAAEHFLQAAALLPPERPVWVAGDGEALDALRRAHPQVRFLGHVQDIAALHQQARVVVGCGRAIVEAMAAGLPAVNLAPSGFGGLVTPQTVEAMAWHNMSGRHAAPSTRRALAEGIMTLLPDTPLRRQLVAWGPTWVRARYAVETAMPVWEATWRQATAIPAPRLRAGVQTGRLLGQLGTTKTWRSLRRRIFSR